MSEARAVVLLLVAILGSACGAAGDSESVNPPATKTDATIETTPPTSTTQAATTTTTVPEPPDGELIYDKRCESCHGKEGEGGTGPELGNGITLELYPDIEDEIAVLTSGIPPLMVAYGDLELLAPDEIRAVVGYVREKLGR